MYEYLTTATADENRGSMKDVIVGNIHMMMIPFLV